tara:strand:- start:780 stop:1415 length:636 start_codon:yes stop_codon:yes gene_type:complete
MDKTKDPHQILQIWFSSSFPIGSYAYSHGVESLIDNKKIQNKSDVIEFLEAVLNYGTLRNDYIFIKSIYNNLEINDLILSNATSKERQIEMIAMGNSFRNIMRDSWDLNLQENSAFIYCVSKAAIYFNIDFNDLIKFYFQSFISNLITVCVKHIPVSQKDGQSINVMFINKIQDFINNSKDLTIDDIGTTFFIGDLFSMKHENQETRIYLT